MNKIKVNGRGYGSDCHKYWCKHHERNGAFLFTVILQKKKCKGRGEG